MKALVIQLAVILNVVGCRAAPPAPSGQFIARDHSVELGPVSSGRLSSGLEVTWQSSFPRNELAASVRTQTGYVALTAAGHLIRFDRRLNLAGERRFIPPLKLLAGGEQNPVWAATKDGRILTVDPSDLSTREIGRVAGEPTWIGAAAPSPNAIDSQKPLVVYATYGTPRAEPSADAQTRPRILNAFDFGLGKTIPLGDTGGASVWFLDGKRRLWFGADRGEWGGSLGHVILDAGTPPKVEKTDDGIYGVGRLPNGRLIAWGGTQHMGLTRAIVSDAESGRHLYAVESFGRGEHHDGPRLPITQVVPDGLSSLIVFAYDGVFQTDPIFAKWTRLADLDIRYRAGRPDAVGVYPALLAVHRIAQSRFVGATRRDGYIDITDGKIALHSLPETTPVNDIAAIRNTADGTLFVGDDEGPCWWLRRGKWEAAVLDPPIAEACSLYHPDPCVTTKPPMSWTAHYVIESAGATLYTASETGWSSGPKILTRWQHGKPSIVARATARKVGGTTVQFPNESQSIFQTPDGTFWYAYDILARLNGDRWEEVADFGSRDSDWPPVRLRTLNRSGPPWILCSEGGDAGLWRLTYSSHFKNVKLDPIPSLANVLDAVALDDGRILVVVEKHRFLVFDLQSSKFSNWSGPTPDGDVEHLVKDGLGRLWFAGDSLWLLDGNGKRLHSLTQLGIVGNPVQAIGADTDHPDGVVLVTGENEVAFVRAADVPADVTGQPPPSKPITK